MANRNLDPSKDEPLVQECTTSSESDSTCSDSTETSEASYLVQESTTSSPPAPKVILTKDEVPIIHSAPVPAISVPVPTPFKQIKISYPPEGRKLNTEKGQSSTPVQPRKVFDICHAPGERVPYVQKTLEEATFEHKKAHPWNFKDLFKRKDYVYLSRDKLAKSYFVCGKYNHTASTCFYYLQQQKNLKQHAFEKTKKNKQVRRFEAKTTQFRNSLSPPREQLSKPLQSCIICGESDHFAANCKFNPFNQILLPTPIIQKPISKVKKDRHTSVLKPSAAKINVADQVKPKQPKGKPSVATKSAAAQVKLSAATKSVAVKPKSLDTTSAVEKAKRARKPPTQQWKAKKPPSIIIGSVECVYPLLNKFPADSFKAVSSNILAADQCIYQQQLSLLLTNLTFHSNQSCSGQAYSSTATKFAADG
ncbi:hypothetical protein L1987_15377 [Smallanthus sonchifolius]|uniref:Uncharacterized protein n=1 Tax=Smallanthus sonchifolius TaxID=185202 RepID=A0ACB9J6Y6_9ASTR|nr:hypothetical protein L1987_15377 [Smallanthus sonchifolius]